MTLPRLLLYFFMIFFSTQLILGEAGILAFFQRKYSTKEFHQNVTELVKVNEYLSQQVKLNKDNSSYLMMNAHRVGLLAEDEYLIKLDSPLLFNNMIYTPGKVLLERRLFYFSNMLLFIISLVACACVVIFRLIQNYFHKEEELISNSIDMVKNGIYKKGSLAQSATQEIEAQMTHKSYQQGQEREHVYHSTMPQGMSTSAIDSNTTMHFS